MLACSFDRFYVVTKFILPTLDDLKLSPIKYDKECKYLCNLDDQGNEQIRQNIKDHQCACACALSWQCACTCNLKQDGHWIVASLIRSWTRQKKFLAKS